MNKGLILVAVDNKGNRELLEESLKRYYEVRTGESESSLNEPFDLAIFDGVSLARMRKQIEDRRKVESSVFLPVLLVTSRQDIGLLTGQLWQSIDEIIFSPIEKRELMARVDVLLRTRGYSVELARLYVTAQENAALEERQRLARELHDSVSQTMFLASTLAQTIPYTQKKDPELAAQQLKEVAELNRSALSEMRMLLLELRPGSVSRSTLQELFDQLILAVQGRRRIEITAHIAIDSPLPEAVHLTLYRIVQEGLNNIVKHSEATAASVSLMVEDGQLCLRIIDDGIGFDTNLRPSGFGLQGMRERAAIIGASFSISSSPNGRGTEVVVSLPISPEIAITDHPSKTNGNIT